MSKYLYNKITPFAVIAVVVSLLASPVSASPARQAAQLTTSGTERTLFLPAAADNAHVISLGSAVDPGSGELVEGYAFIHRRDAYDHKPNHGGGRGKPGGGDTGSTCFAFLAKDARWKNTESYVVDATNAAGLLDADVRALMAAGVDAWDSEVAFDVFGNEVAGIVDGADMVSPDDVNEVMFANIDSQGAIAVTIVWGVFGGRPSARRLVEWDMVFDDVDFSWSTDGSAGAMDFLNIAVHEIGHAAGMGHPDNACTDETMYAFAALGETKKRDLNAGDIAGILKLYK